MTMTEIFKKNADGTKEIIIRDMEIESYVITFEQLALMVKTGIILNSKYIKAEMPGEQRDERAKSTAENLEDIKDFLTGANIGIISLVRKGDTYYIVDGGHRTRMIARFLNGEISLKTGNEKTRFSELSKKSQEYLKNRIVTIGIESGKDADVKRSFFRKNAGKSVTPIEKLHSEYFDTLGWMMSEEIVNHFSETEALKDFIGKKSKANDGYTMNHSILQIMGLCMGSDLGILFDKNTAIKTFLKDMQKVNTNKPRTRSIQKFQREIEDVFNFIINSQIMKRIPSKTRTCRSKMNFTNIAYVTYKVANSMLPGSKTRIDFKKILRQMEDEEYLARLELILSESTYLKDCSNGKDFKKQVETLEGAVRKAF